MEPNESDIDRVRDLWMKYLGLCFQSGEDPSTKRFRGMSSFVGYHDQGAISGFQEELLLSIFQIVGKTCPVATPLELAALLRDDQIAHLRDSECEDEDDTDEALDAWDQKDRNFFRKYLAPTRYLVHYSVRLCLAGDVSLDLPLGGSRLLVLTMGQGKHRIRLTGTLEGVIWRGGAIEAASRSIEEVLGAGFALGLFDLRRLVPGARATPVLFDEFSRDGALWAPPCDEDDDPDDLLDPGEEELPGVAVPEPAARMIRGVAVSLDDSASDIERERRRRGELSPEGDRSLRPLPGLFAAANERGLEVRNAASLLARAATEPDLGTAIGTTVTCLEALLLEKDAHQDVTARLAEAVAYRLGGCADRRRELRAEIRRVYKVRSTFTHTGRVERDVAFSTIRQNILEIARETLRREIEEFLP